MVGRPSRRKAIGMLVVTHGRLADELVAAARRVVGEIEALESVSIEWDTDPDDAAARIETAIHELHRPGGVLVATDMFGGTPTNLALSRYDDGAVEVITGVNLPMLIRFANLRDEPTLHEAAARIAAQGREAIHVATEVLAAGDGDEDGDRG